MDALLTEVAKQVPSLVVLATIVWWFLSHLARERDAGAKLDEERQKALQHLSNNYHGFQMDMLARTEAITDKVAEALDRNTDALARNTSAFERVDRLLDGAKDHFRRR